MRVESMKQTVLANEGGRDGSVVFVSTIDVYTSIVLKGGPYEQTEDSCT
jgi:hypothetical protein